MIGNGIICLCIDYIGANTNIMRNLLESNASKYNKYALNCGIN